MNDNDIIQDINFPNNTVLDDAYSELYNSLGVEPGLLSKTRIGTKLNEKYHNDSIDAQIYSERYLRDNLKKIDNNELNNDTTNHSIIKTNPLFDKNIMDKPVNKEDKFISLITIPDENGIGINKSNITIDEPSIFATLDYYQHYANITDGKLLEELRIFIEERFNYTIIKKEEK